MNPQVWIILELCTGGTLLDAALSGRCKFAGATQQAGDRMEMVRRWLPCWPLASITRMTLGLATCVAVHSLDRGCLLLKPLESCIGNRHNGCVTDICIGNRHNACVTDICRSAAVAQAKLLSRLLDAANGMAYLHARGILHVSGLPCV